MRAIAIPQHDVRSVYRACTNSIGDIALRNRLAMVENSIVTAAQDYQQRAAAKQLYSIPPDSVNNDDIVIGAVTKKELKDVYSQHMVGRGKPARATYDQLLATAPLGRCPFCGFGYASTLDHYLPKTKYPLVSIAPVNLVPACKDCNTGKSTRIATTEEEQSLHPYFDHQHFVTEQWLYADVIRANPAKLRFYVAPPDHWDKVSKRRVESHFNDFKLASRYADEAGSQLAILRGVLNEYHHKLGDHGVKQHLEIEANVSLQLHPNSWQTAMFQALAESDWYCSGGFN